MGFRAAGPHPLWVGPARAFLLQAAQIHNYSTTITKHEAEPAQLAGAARLVAHPGPPPGCGIAAAHKAMPMRGSCGGGVAMPLAGRAGLRAHLRCPAPLEHTTRSSIGSTSCSRRAPHGRGCWATLATAASGVVRRKSTSMLSWLLPHYLSFAGPSTPHTHSISNPFFSSDTPPPGFATQLSSCRMCPSS